MRIEGDKLLLVIATQDVPVRVMDAAGKLERLFPNPKELLKFVAGGGYFGIGNHRRVSIIQPISEADQRAVFCGKRTDKLVLNIPARRPQATRMTGSRPHLADSTTARPDGPRTLFRSQS